MVANRAVVAIVLCSLLPIWSPAWAADAGGATAAYSSTTPSGPEIDAAVKDKRNKRLKVVADQLRDIADNFGPDAVVLQVKLMMKSLAAGALRPTQVRVVGPSEEPNQHGETLLVIDTDTGLLFDTSTTTRAVMEEKIWNDIAGSALAEMSSFNIEPKGLKLQFNFGLQDTSLFAQPLPDPTREFDSDHVTFWLPASALEKLLAGETTTESLKTTSHPPVQ